LTVVPLDPDRAARPDDGWSDRLVTVARHQDREAFARLFAHFAPRVKRFLMLAGSSQAQAEELAQETMAAVWRKAALYDPARAAASTWIFAIARNLRVDSLRRSRADAAGDECFEADLLEADQPAAEDALHAARLNERLRGALAQLKPEQVQVLRLSYFDDEPHARIAAVLGIPLGTVKSRIRLAVAQLRRLLER
jgi:RNA polymerase sigma-70 factor (ECF subfamily)